MVAKPVLALCLLIDCSGSMAEDKKLALAREAAVAALDRLHEKDLIGVVAFNSKADWVVPLSEARHNPRIAASIRTLRPSGETNIETALRAAGGRLERLDCPVKHIVLISDGHTGPATFKALVGRMTKAGITMSTIGVGEHFDSLLMSNLAKWGRGRFFATEAAEVPEIAIAETKRALGAARPHRRKKRKPDRTPRKPDKKPDKIRPRKQTDPKKQTPTPQDPEPSRDVRALVRAGLLAGVGPPFPAVGPTPQTDTRPGATVVLATRDGHPVLATWRHAVGRVALLTCDVSGEHAGDWRGWRALPRLLSQLTTHVLADPTEPTVQIEHRVAWRGGPRGQAICDIWLSTADGPWSGTPTVHDLRTGQPLTAAPRQAGTGWWRLTAPAHAAAWAIRAGDAEQRLTLHAPEPPDLGDPAARLTRLARASGGRVGVRPESLLGLPVRRPGRGPWAPGLPLALGAVLLALGAAVWRTARP